LFYLCDKSNIFCSLPYCALLSYTSVPKYNNFLTFQNQTFLYLTVDGKKNIKIGNIKVILVHYWKMGQRSRPKVSAAVAAGTDVSTGCNSSWYLWPGLGARKGIWYRVMARPGTNTGAQAPGGASNWYQMTTTAKAPVRGITRCLLCR